MANQERFLALHFVFTFLNLPKLLLASECPLISYSWVYMPVYDDVVLVDDILQKHTGVVTRLECSAVCGIDSRCESFFYNEVTFTCQTHSVIFLDARGISSTGTKYFRKPTDPQKVNRLSCLPTDCYIGSSVNPSARLFDSQGMSGSSGRMLMDACEPCRLQMEEITCLQEGNPVTMWACKRPSKCSEVKTLMSISSDGEYWLYPPLFGGEKAKIYCHGMSTTSPAEYVTLVTPNTGHYPSLENPDCQYDRYKALSGAGDTTFTKIRLDTEKMEVILDNFQFATSTGNLNKYAEAGDCYKGHGATNQCGPKGTFHVNTVGTGVIVSEQVQWIKHGWQPWSIVSKSSDGLVIDLNCGGFCGGCFPDKLVLEHYSAQEPGIESATVIPCA